MRDINNINENDQNAPTHPRSKFSKTIRLTLLLIVLILTPTVAAQEPEIGPLVRAQRSTVFLMQTYEDGGIQTLSCIGSGTLVDPSGLILTNAHLALPVGPCQGEQIIVALPVRLDESPVPTYIAEVVQVDLQHDLAILQISGSLDGSPIERETLNLPSVNITDPSGVLPGNTLTFVGYPNAGASSVAVTEGVITSITTETSGSRMAWFRTEADLEGGISGGGAFDANGQLIGVPTSAPGTSGATPGPMCLSIQDNTRDGLITERDACVPIGGKVTSIRPVSFAAPLIEAARNDFELSSAPGLPVTPLVGEPTFSRLFFSTNVDNNGVPTKIVSTLPSGSRNLFLFFDYENMRPGTSYDMQVTRDGIILPSVSVGPLAWMGDNKGTWYIGTENTTWLDGEYDFTLLIAGSIVASASITIGGQVTESTFANLQFGIPDGAGGFTASGTLLPVGVQQVEAKFEFENMVEGEVWTEIWYLDGTEISNVTNLWEGGDAGIRAVTATNFEGLPLGNYRVELLIGDRLAATGDIVLAGNIGPQSQSMVFSNARIAEQATRDGEPAGQVVQSGAVLPLGVTDLYAFVNWDFMPNNVQWTYRWFLDGRLVASSTQSWTSGGVGFDYWIRLHANGTLQEGLYAVEVLVEGQPMFSANVAVGSGTLPPEGATDSDDVFVSGTVIDALTGHGIPGALVMVLDVRFESPQFNWDESQVHTQAITDREGRFSFTRGLARGELGSFYTFFVFAEGYTTIVEDTFWILQAYPEEIDIVIEMNQP